MRVYWAFKHGEPHLPLDRIPLDRLRAIVAKGMTNSGRNGASTEDLHEQARIVISLKEQGFL